MSEEINIPLLRKAVEWAEAEWAKSWSECLWYQGDWVSPNGWVLTKEKAIDPLEEQKGTKCGTAYCIAGWTSVLTLRAGEFVSDDGFVRTSEGVPVEYCSNRAQRELGITKEQAGTLFDGDNTIEDVRRIAEEIAGERL